jgi:hypothetical protein
LRWRARIRARERRSANAEDTSSRAESNAGGKGGGFEGRVEGLKKLLNAVLGRGRRYCDFLNGSVFGEIEQCKIGIEKGEEEYLKLDEGLEELG